jgi:hypothetical protein
MPLSRTFPHSDVPDRDVSSIGHQVEGSLRTRTSVPEKVYGGDEESAGWVI